jgi:hypothetical protein
MNETIVYDAVLNLAGGAKTFSANGWAKFNGACCIHNGEKRVDDRGRQGIIIEDGVTTYNCFNCKFKTRWQPGRRLSKKFENYFEWANMPKEEIKRLKFKIWQIEGGVIFKNNTQKSQVFLDFPDAELPKDAMPFSYWITLDNPSEDFLKILEYLDTRGSTLFNAMDYWWTPDRKNSMNRRIIIPFTWNNRVVGYTARAIYPTSYRYYTEAPPKYFFGMETIRPEHKFITLSEGPFDALALGGLASLGDKLGIEQRRWLNQQNKTIIVMPDREKNGGKLVDIALEEGWQVSFPVWGSGVKDAADASRVFGQLYTLWSVIDSITNNPLEINVRRKLEFK